MQDQMSQAAEQGQSWNLGPEHWHHMPAAEIVTCCVDEVEPSIDGALVRQSAPHILFECWLEPLQCIESNG